MSTKTSSSVPDQDAVAGDPMTLNLLANLGRYQLALMTESACAMFRGAEAMREIQKEAAHQASARHEDAAQKLRGACKPDEMTSIQSDLLRLNLQEATQYWQDLATVALKTQVEMLGSVNRVLSNGANSEGGFKPMIDVWQAMVSRSLNGSNGSAG